MTPWHREADGGPRYPGTILRTAFLAAGLALVVGLGACSDTPSTEVVAGSGTQGAASSGESGQPILKAVLEPTDALMADPGEGWIEVDRWYTEGSMTHWGTGCSSFDRLGDIFNHGTPQTVVWSRSADRMFQRTDDFGWEANEFADVVEKVPSTCSTVEIGAVTVSTTAVEPALLGPAADRITEGDPNGRVVAVAFDAYPYPSLETDIATPEFEPGRPTWMVVATRHNVVSQLVYSPDDGSGPEHLADLVAVQVDALVATPVEASGPFQKPAPPPSVAPVTTHSGSPTTRPGAGGAGGALGYGSPDERQVLGRRHPTRSPPGEAQTLSTPSTAGRVVNRS